MNCIWSTEVDSILATGRPLSDLSVRNWALDRDSAQLALDQLASLGIAVLGGDIYVPDGTSFRQNYDNWYCNRMTGESDNDFLARSISTARDYISKYLDAQAHYAIVPDIKP